MSKPVFKDVFAFSGRRNRKSYILYGLATAVISIIVTMVVTGLLSGTSADMGEGDSSGVGAMIAMGLAGLFGLMLFISGLAVAVQRCHDLGWTGWYLLMYFVPLANLYLIFRLIFVPGTDGNNRYGPDPLAS